MWQAGSARLLSSCSYPFFQPTILLCRPMQQSLELHVVLCLLHASSSLFTFKHMQFPLLRMSFLPSVFDFSRLHSRSHSPPCSLSPPCLSCTSSSSQCSHCTLFSFLFPHLISALRLRLEHLFFVFVLQY